MMTDRELLELAAKATGIKALWSPDGLLRDCTNGHPAQNIYSAPPWNPLTDDGDALRLAVKLQIDMEFYVENGSTSAVLVEYCDYRCNIGRDEVEPKGDIYLATRRAIVHAAAEIGKEKK